MRRARVEWKKRLESRTNTGRHIPHSIEFEDAVGTGQLLADTRILTDRGGPRTQGNCDLRACTAPPGLAPLPAAVSLFTTNVIDNV